MKRFFIGADAGCIGYTSDGYPIRDYQLVMVKSDINDKVKLIYQVQTVRGIMEDENFVEAKPKCEKYTSTMCDPEYILTYWVGDRQIPETELKTQYKVKDVTDIVKAVAAFADENSPYISKACLDIFQRNRELSARNPADKPIIAAVRAVMNG